MKHHLQKTTHERLITLFSFAVVLVASLGATTWSNALYILTGVEDAAIVLDGSQEALIWAAAWSTSPLGVRATMSRSAPGSRS